MAQEVSVAILVADGFIPTELALAQDILRIASRLEPNLRFTSLVCSVQGEPLVEGRGGILVRAVPFAIDECAQPNHLIVLGGSGAGENVAKLRARLRWLERMGRSVILLSDAAFEWQKLNPDNTQLTTHWEIQQRERDAGFTLSVDLPLFSQASRITTAAGMASTADVVLDRIVAPVSLRLAQAVGKVLLLENIRDGDARQPRSENDVSSIQLTRLGPVVAAMEENLDTPLRVAELACVAGISIRQLERKFQRAVGQGPAAFYRSLRLRRARALIEQTALSMSEIAVACGWGTSSSFSKIYAQEFGQSPAKRRAQLLATSTKHQFSLLPHGAHNAPVPLSPRPSRPPIHTAGTDETTIRGA